LAASRLGETNDVEAIIFRRDVWIRDWGGHSVVPCKVRPYYLEEAIWHSGELKSVQINSLEQNQLEILEIGAILIFSRFHVLTKPEYEHSTVSFIQNIGRGDIFFSSINKLSLRPDDKDRVHD
jgi:hypothetical protein